MISTVFRAHPHWLYKCVPFPFVGHDRCIILLQSLVGQKMLFVDAPLRVCRVLDPKVIAGKQSQSKFSLPARRRLLFPLLHAEKGPFSACNKGNRRRLHAGKSSPTVTTKLRPTYLETCWQEQQTLFAGPYKYTQYCKSYSLLSLKSKN